MDVELEHFKANINLVEFASIHAYSELDKRRSSRACTVLRNGSEKIGVSRDKDNHWVFYNFDKEDGGSIIDFVMYINNCNLGVARRYLRSYVGKTSPPLSSSILKLQRQAVLTFEKFQLSLRNFQILSLTIGFFFPGRYRRKPSLMIDFLLPYSPIETTMLFFHIKMKME